MTENTAHFSWTINNESVTVECLCAPRAACGVCHGGPLHAGRHRARLASEGPVPGVLTAGSAGQDRGATFGWQASHTPGPGQEAGPWKDCPTGPPVLPPVPGTSEDWTRVNNHSSEQLSGSALSTTSDTPSDNPTAHHRPRRWAFVAGAAALAVIASGSVAYAEAVKTVTLDVDGTTTTVTTVAGSVDGLLARQGIRTGERDVVAPAPDTELVDGTQIVVRYGRQVTVAADGQQSDVWLTVVDADEALDALADRGATVSLVASRSGDRASLPLRLDTDGPVAVVADGTTRVATDGSEGVDGILSGLKIELDGDDRVSVQPTDDVSGAAAAADGAEVALVVQRVETTEVTTTEAVAFTTETRQDAERYEDLADVVEQEGADGVRTRVERVTTVDGAEESREMLSDEVTQAPVNKVVVEGTKERPVVTAPTTSAPAPTTTSSGATTGPVMAGTAREIGQQLAAARGWTGEQWTCLDLLFQRESGWNPYAANPSSGAYGIPQALPGSKMGTVADDWRTNPATQITWGLNYIAGRYGTPCGAWGHSESAGWY